jgi:AcrR family transcriptional regulator
VRGKRPTKKPKTRRLAPAASYGGVTDSAKTLLIEAAKKCFAERGFDGATVREIAWSSGVNIALVSYHFGGKEGLYHACLAEFGHSRLRAMEHILQPPRSREELRVRLEMFVVEILESWVREPDIHRIIHQECEHHANRFEELFQSTFHKIFENVIAFFKAAHKAGLLRESADPELVAGHLFGIVVHATRSDIISEKYKGVTLKDAKHRAKFIQSLLDFTLEGVCK